MEPIRYKLGPIAALTMLQLYIERKVKLDVDELEMLLDTVFDYLTDVRDAVLVKRQWLKKSHE